MQVRVELRRVPRQPMELAKRNRALAGWPMYMDLGVERSQRHAHVRWVSGNAGLACAEDRVDAVEAVDGGAAAARLALIARRRNVVEGIAASTLPGVAAGRGQICPPLRGPRH